MRGNAKYVSDHSDVISINPQMTILNKVISILRHS